MFRILVAMSNCTRFITDNDGAIDTYTMDVAIKAIFALSSYIIT